MTVWQFIIFTKNNFIQIEGAFLLGLLFSYILMRLNRFPPPFLLLVGSVYILQLEHIIGALKINDYYPGLITGIALSIIGFFFWKELLKALFKN